jgi:hypothetical protein
MQRGRPPRNYRRSDERVREDIYEQLSRGSIDADDVTVEVQDGRVTLRGTVPDRWMKHTVEDIADNCPGVQDVDNQMRVQRGQGSSGGSQGQWGHGGSQSHAGQGTTGGSRSSSGQMSGSGASGASGLGSSSTASGGSSLAGSNTASGSSGSSSSGGTSGTTGGGSHSR